jgi:hypothetical protein
LPTEVTADLVFLLDRECGSMTSHSRVKLVSCAYSPASSRLLPILHSCYYNTLAELTTSALIATGGTAIAALTMLTEWGLQPSQIKLVSVLGSKQGVAHVAEEFPDVEVNPLQWQIDLLELLVPKLTMGIDLHRGGGRGADRERVHLAWSRRCCEYNVLGHGTVLEHASSTLMVQGDRLFNTHHK